MKKIIIFTLTLSILFSLASCSNEKETPSYDKDSYSNVITNNDVVSTTNKPTSVTDEELEDIVSDLEKANEYANKMAAILVTNWTTESYFAYFYDEIRFRNSSFEDEEDYATVHKNREMIEQTLDDVKQLIETEGTGEFHNAVKEYYLALSDYLTLLSEFPAGYSKVTYSTAISDCQNKCRTCNTNVNFYID